MNRTIGTVVAPQGLDGSVRLRVETAFPEERLKPGTQVKLLPPEGTPQMMKVRACRRHRVGAVVGFFGVTGREGAQALVGATVLSLDDDYALPSGHFYVDDVIGCDVVDAGGKALGSVTDVLQGKVQDIWVIEGAAGRHLVPGVKAWVEVDLDVRRVRLKQRLEYDRED